MIYIRYLILNTKTNQYMHSQKGWVSTVSEASKFKKKDTAESFLNNNLSYICPDTKVDEVLILCKDNVGAVYFEGAGEADDALVEFKNCIKKSYEEIHKFKGLQDHYNTELSRVDLESQDLLHAIEFSNANAAEGYKLYKKLQELRRRRRLIKDNLAMASILSQTDVLSSLESAIQSIDKLERHKEVRTYRPRVLTELFK